MPFTVTATDSGLSVDGDDDLNRVMRMRGHEALRSASQQETSLPQIPSRNAQPAIRLFVVGGVGQAGILPAGAHRRSEADAVCGIRHTTTSSHVSADLLE
jgi:hypothetical protein